MSSRPWGRSSGRPTDADGTPCSRFTDKGHLCPQHAVQLLGVCVQPSLIPGAGLGLFAAGRSFDRGDVVCEYEGRILASTAQFLSNPSAYGVRLYKGVLDARFSNEGFGRFANTSANMRGRNAQLITQAKLRRGGSGSRVFLQAVKRIEDGEEVLIHYEYVGQQLARKPRRKPRRKFTSV